MPSQPWFTDMLGWKRASSKATPRCLKLFQTARGPNLADLSNTPSTAIAGAIYRELGIPVSRAAADLNDNDGKASSGALLERLLEQHLAWKLPRIDSQRDWGVTRAGSVSQYAQYVHLAELQALFDSIPTLRSVLGQSYEVSTDVMVHLPNPDARDGPRVLHAAVSSKLTIRSDRVQNIRHEFATLVRNRKGRAPHLVVVTAEPLPSRVRAIAQGTGEVDAVYHLLFDEMDAVLTGKNPGTTTGAWREQATVWSELVEQQRVRAFDKLAEVLASG